MFLVLKNLYSHNEPKHGQALAPLPRCRVSLTRPPSGVLPGQASGPLLLQPLPWIFPSSHLLFFNFKEAKALNLRSEVLVLLVRVML